jgi:hypothetical protein
MSVRSPNRSAPAPPLPTDSLFFNFSSGFGEDDVLPANVDEGRGDNVLEKELIE